TDPLAEAIGAVNTLVRQDGGFYGYNTDIEGLRRELREEGISAEGRKCIITGAGGAARAAAFMLLTEGASGITIINRNVKKAEDIAVALKRYAESMDFSRRFGSTPEISAIGLEEANDLKGGDYIAIQCTSVGLKPGTDGAVIEDPVFYGKLSFAVDVIYSPATTKFMQNCRENGVRAVNGLKMLLYQAVCAFELWNGIKLSDEITAKAYDALYSAQMKNIVLTGCMGAGKTSVGKRLAARLGYRFVDTDELISAREKKSINEIFAQNGEEYFRDLETETVRELSGENDGKVNGGGCFSDPEDAGKPGKIVLSVGGGLPVRESNRSYLKKIGIVVYLRATEETLLDRVRGDSERPLLKENKKRKLHELLESRSAIYEETADIVIDTDDLTLDEVILKGERVL
ncbi:MAG: AAA family ATPase, partial [Lachnospiraceae bacterium]|nr:AAA family ATPase [Lachnospiraceae bacterium]